MKKIFTKLMLLAVAAAALVSCENNYDEQTLGGELTQTVTLSAEKPTEVRTQLIEGVPYWSKGDQIGVYVVDGEGYKNYAFKNDSEEATLTTSFTGETAVVNSLYVYYPYTNFNNPVTEKGVKVEILANQEPTAASFDGRTDLMIAKPVQLDAGGKQLSDLEFARVAAIVKIVLKDKTTDKLLTGQHVSSLTMTAATNLVGRVYLDVVNQEINSEEGLYYGGDPSVTATYTEATQYEVNGENATYVIVYPQTLAAGSELTFAAETSSGDYTISRTLTIPAEVYPDGIVLESGKVTTLNVSLNDGDVKEVGGFEGVDNAYNLILATKHLKVGDKVVFVAAASAKAMGAQNSNNRASVDVTKNSNNTVDIDSNVTVFTVVEGKSEGTFAFQSSEGYICAASSDKNYLRQETTLSDNSTWSVNIAEGIATVQAQGSYTRNWLRFNPTNTPPIFSCYASGQADVAIYKLVGEYDIKAPAITLSIADVTVEHDAPSGEVTVTATNGDGWAITAATEAEATWVKNLNYANGKITFTTEANDGDARSATVTVTATKADYKDVTATFKISQKAKPAEGGEGGEVVEPVTATLSFANKAQRTAFSTSSQTWEQNGIKLVNDKAASTNNVADYANPARFYKSSKITITAPGNIKEVVFTASGYTDALKSSVTAEEGTASVSGTKVTIIPASQSNTFVINSLTGGQVRASDVTVTYVTGGSSEGGETPETPATPVLTITTTAPIEVGAEGDVATVAYTITNPIASQSVTASADETWVNTFDYSEAGKVSFVVDANNTGAAREATVTLSYDVATAQTIKISQAAGEVVEPENPGTEATKKYTFSSYTVGTQYAANEAHKLDDVLTIKTTECHFTSELRIYSSNAHNGYAIGTLADGATIKSLGFNAGNKVDTLNVYGSTDGNTWILVSAVSITSTSYKDYSVEFGNTNYTHFKLDVAGTEQVRLKTLTLTYVK